MLVAKVNGIPCLIDVHHVSVVKGSFSYNAPSDVDYYGYEEFDYTICDRRGRPAPWLERKATKDDIADIEERILNDYKDD